jgi:hypothetical protein
MSATVDDYPTVGRIGRVLARAAMVRCHDLPVAAQLLEELEPELTGTSQAAMGNDRGLAGTRGECVDETITNFHENLPDYAVRASNGANGSVNALASTATGRRSPDDEGLAVLQPVRRQGR